MRSASCQSGPCSRMTTFLPAFASTAAKTEPDAPAPTMTTSTFSFAMSPPFARRDVRPIGNAEGGIPVHGAVDDVDGIAAQHQIDEWSRRALPALDLVLAHAVDEVALLGFAQFSEGPAVVESLAGSIDRPQRSAIEIRIRWAHVENARLEQRLFRRDRYLLIDKMGYAGLARTWDQRLAHRVERHGLRGRERPQRNPLRARRAWREQNLGTADRESESAHCRALHKGASLHLMHDLLPRARITRSRRAQTGQARLERLTALSYSCKIQRRFHHRIQPERAPPLANCSTLLPNNRSAFPLAVRLACCSGSCASQPR